MVWTAAPVTALAIVVGAAGIAKLARPRPTAQALRDARIPGLRTASELHASAIGCVEIAVAACSMAWGNTVTTATVAVVQFCFAAFALRLLTVRGGAGSCGCFGSARSPVHPVHVALNVVCALLAGAAATTPPGPVSHMIGEGPAGGVPLLIAACLAAWAIVAAFTSLPELLMEARTVADDGVAA